MPLPDASFDLVFSNLMLPWCEDIDAVFAEVARVLKPRGLFTFTTFGPDTLVELRAAWRAADDASHVHPFTDMHDLGDGLVRAGFAEPVLDVSPLHADLSGRRRADARPEGDRRAERDERTPARAHRPRPDARRWPRPTKGSARTACCRRAYEVVFGQAWGALERGGRDGEFSFPVSDIGRREPRGR